MQVLRHRFRKNLVTWLVIVILVGSGLASGIGYLADNYFGETVDGLMGSYGENDFLLTINQELKKTAYKKVKEVVDKEIPGSELNEGITVAGKANYFLQIDKKFRDKATFSKIEERLEKIVGVEGASLITEPKLALRGLVGNSNQIFEKKIKKLPEVNFILRKGSELDIILKSSADLELTRKKVKQILDKYQVLQVRFPINQDSREIAELSNKLQQELQTEFSPQQIQGLNATQKANLDDLTKTMNQMKSFLLNYTTIVQIELPADIKIDSNQTLALAGQSDRSLTVGGKVKPETVLLTPLEQKEGVLKAIISKGDGAQITGENLYLINESGRIGRKLGKAQIKRPRYLLQKAIEETEQAIPELNKASKNIDDMNQKLLNWLNKYEKGLNQIEDLQVELADKQGKLNNLGLNNKDLQQLSTTVTQITELTTELERRLTELKFVQKKLMNLNSDFRSFERKLEKQVGLLSLTGLENKRMVKLRDSVRDLRQGVTSQTDEIVGKINQYNPLLNKLQKWNNNLQAFEKLLSSANKGKLNVGEIKESFQVVSGNMEQAVDSLDDVNQSRLNQGLMKLKTSLVKLDQMNLELIGNQLTQLQQALPNLKDEEITGTINLLDKYLAGQVVPGEVAYFLVRKDVRQQALKTKVNSYFTNQKVSQLFTEAGIVEPNIRGELFRILGKVRETLTAIIAVIFTGLILFLDLSIVMSSVQYLNCRRDNKLTKFLNSSYLYGILIGGFLLTSIFSISQAQLPYLNLYHIFMVGSLLGALAANKAQAINPIDPDEFLAGEALGLDYTEIMQEIIIPEGRPGVLSLLNTKELVFK